MFMIVFLCQLVGFGLTPVDANAEVVGNILPSMDVVLAQYESQLATADPLQAMEVLDSLASGVFWKLGDYDLSWNPQTQELEASLQGTDVQIEISTGIDALGRQTFQILVPDEGPITGWVDVDIARKRIIISEDKNITRIGLQLSELDSYGMRSVLSVGLLFCTCHQQNGTNHNLCTHKQCDDAASCRIELGGGVHAEGTCFDVVGGGFSIAQAP